MAEKISFSAQISGRVRLATESDVPHLHKLMYEMAKYHNYTKVFNATEASISTNLFNSNNPCPPFYSVTTFILEVSPNTFPQENTKSSIFDPILKTINLDSPMLDLESELFRTSNNNIFSAMSQVRSGEDSVYAALPPSYKDRKTVFDEPSTQELFRTTTTNNNIFSIMSQVRSEEGDVYEASPLSCKDRKTVSDNYNIVVAGYVLFYPSYSGYFDKPGFFIENMYVRECYRKCGFGKMLFSAVASQAVKMGFTKVDWLTVGWNENAIDFYLGMGAYIMQDVKRFRLSGEGLDAFATTNEDADKS